MILLIIHKISKRFLHALRPISIAKYDKEYLIKQPHSLFKQKIHKVDYCKYDANMKICDLELIIANIWIKYDSLWYKAIQKLFYRVIYCDQIRYLEWKWDFRIKFMQL